MTNKITAIVLASGNSSRLSGYNKLLLPLVCGKTLVEKSLSVFDTVKINKKILVFSENNVAQKSIDYGFLPVYNDFFLSGKASAIKCGIQNCAEESDFLFISGDLCSIDAKTIDTVIKTAQKTNADIVFTNGGLPAFFSHKTRRFLQNLHGENGGKSIIPLMEQEKIPVRIQHITVSSNLTADIDTWQDYFDYLKANGKNHIFIQGKKGSGKSTLAFLIAKSGFVFDGIVSYVVRGAAKNENHLFIESVTGTSKKCLAARLNQTDKSILELNTNAFNDFAVNLLDEAQKKLHNKDGILLIDEIGRLEKNARLFQQKVCELLNSAQRCVFVLQEDSIDFNDFKNDLLGRSDYIALKPLQF